MAMNGVYLDTIANTGKSLITHIGLVDASGVEIASAGYARQPVTWTGPTSGDGLIRPDADIVFNMTAGDVVAGWRGFSAVTSGVNYGGGDLTQVTFGNDGTYTLLAAATAIDHNS